MAVSKVIYKSSASATPETWMDATTATAAAADITSPKTAMLANGVMTEGTGSGGGGLQAKTGTYTFLSDYTLTYVDRSSNDVIKISTGLTDIKVVSVVSQGCLTMSSTRPCMFAASWIKGILTDYATYYPSQNGIAVSVVSTTANWTNSTGSVNPTSITTNYNDPDYTPSGSFSLFARSTSYLWRSGTTITWEAIGT